ncbi:MAG: hypothetical protein U1F48_02075 [Burkholderiales bacterium]
MTCHRIPTLRLHALAALAAMLAATAHAATEVPVAERTSIVAVPPVTYRGPTVERRTALVTPAGAPARRIDLPAPLDAEAAPMRAYNQFADDKGQPLAIGYGRELPPAARDIPLAALDWTPDAGGGRSARIEIASPGAAALRVALALDGAPSGLAFRFAGTAADARAFGPFAASEVARERVYWSPVLAGDTATIEISADPDVALDALVLHVPRVSHALVDGAGLRSLSAPVMKATGIGASASCNVDVACVAATNAPAANFAKSVAKLTFVGDTGGSFLCTGTLVADSVQSQTPYLFGASHCLDSANVARTLNTYWFYDATTCNSNASPPFVHLAGGATLLARSADRDWVLVRLNDVPPAGTQFAAWRAEAIATGTSVATLHHPAGDLGKISTGSVTGDYLLDAPEDGINGFFTEVTWSKGVTQGGSSGSALVTLAPGGGWYELRGGLFGGLSSCTAQGAPDYFSHLDAALPQVRQYLTPNAANPRGVVPAVEFYNRSLDHYFLSTNPVEIANLDSGRTVGWARTGLRFLVYDNPQPGASPVCRFYRAPAYGDSHFYSASPDECAATAAAHPVDWIYESPNVFYVPLPDKATGACPAGTQSVYRYFNAATTNHRYTQELTVRDAMAYSPLWLPEGYGPGPYYPIMCGLLSQ